MAPVELSTVATEIVPLATGAISYCFSPTERGRRVVEFVSRRRTRSTHLRKLLFSSAQVERKGPEGKGKDDNEHTDNKLFSQVFPPPSSCCRHYTKSEAVVEREGGT